MAFLAPHFWSGKMCTLCELQLFNDHQALEREFYNLRPKCKKLPDASGHEGYHRFSVGDIVDEGSEVQWQAMERRVSSRQEGN